MSSYTISTWQYLLGCERWCNWKQNAHWHTVPFSPVPWPFGSSGGHDRQFSRFSSAGGHCDCEHFLHGQCRNRRKWWQPWFQLSSNLLTKCCKILPALFDSEMILHPMFLSIKISGLYKWSTLSVIFVSRCGLAVRRLAGKQKDLGSIRFGSPFSSLQKIVVYGHCLVTLPTQFNETLKWLTQLPTLMQNHSGGDSVASRC